ncbi:MAG: transposase [Bacteroidota bacterium]
MPNRLLTFAHLAHSVAERTLPARAHKFAPERYTQPQLLACLLVKEYLGLDYRTAQETLELSDGLREALGLTAVPDYSTLWRFARDKATGRVIADALVETLRLFKASGHDPPQRDLVAIDSTGLYCGHASRYFEQRRRKHGPTTHRARGYQKWAAALWTGPQLITAQLSKLGPCGDYPDLPPLAEASIASVPGALVLADAGYDSERNHVFCRERLGVKSLIPAKTRRYVAGPRGRYRAEMVAALGCAALGVAGESEPRRVYGQRWLVETLMSVVKRKWGERLTARLPAMQEAQALLRGLVYNLYRLIILGVQPVMT